MEVVNRPETANEEETKQGSGEVESSQPEATIEERPDNALPGEVLETPQLNPENKAEDKRPELMAKWLGLAEKYKEVMIGQPFTITYGARMTRRTVAQVQYDMEQLSNYMLCAVTIDKTGERRFVIVTDPRQRLQLAMKTLEFHFQENRDFINYIRYMTQQIALLLPEEERAYLITPFNSY